MLKKIAYLPLLLLVANLKLNAQTHRDTIEKRLNAYKKVVLNSNISSLTQDQRRGLKFLIIAAQEMNNLFWLQTFGNKNELDSINDPIIKEFAMVNYGPWDRLNDNKPFVKGYGEKPLGANFYPKDMRKGEFDSLEDKNKSNPNTLIVRENGVLRVINLRGDYMMHLSNASRALQAAAMFLKESDSTFSKFLDLRALALMTQQFNESDIAWLDMKDNLFDIIIGPIESYEDQLLGIRTSYEAYVLIKDLEWSKRLDKYVAYLPELQENLPVDTKYKAEKAGSSSQLNAYDVVYYAGDCNAGSKTIAVNLPNDEKLQIEKGTRRSQLKNAIKAKFDHIMLPITKELIDPSQIKHLTFDAFFSTIMFHEVAHGLGIKNTINNKGTVKDALGADFNALEEGKADILGLYMITQLYNKKVLKDGELMDYYVTFMAGIFRSVRFGAASAHGKANMIRFNYFKEKGAFTRNASGTYTINFEKMKEAMTSLSALIIKLQGDGDIDGVKKLLEEKGKINDELQKDLDRLTTKNIPIDIIFEQGLETLGLNIDEPLNTPPPQKQIIITH